MAALAHPVAGRGAGWGAPVMPAMELGMAVVSAAGNRGTLVYLQIGLNLCPYAFDVRLESGEVASLPITYWGTRWVPEYGSEREPVR